MPNHRRNTIARIDTATLKLTDMIEVAGALNMFAAEDGAVWVTTQCEDCPTTTVIRIDPATRRITHRADFEGQSGFGVALLEFDGAIWIAGQDGEIARIKTR